MLRFIFIFLFACSSIQAVESPWKVEVTKNKEIVAFGDIISVHIRVDYPSSYEPNLFEFLMQQKRISEYGYFQLLSSNYTNTGAHLDILLQLQPEKIGTLIFTPGLFSFSPKENSLPLYELLVPAFSIESKGLFPAPKIAPPLPFNPEKMININPENYKATFENPDLTAKEKQYNLERAIAKSHAWTTLALIFFIASLAAVIFWFLKEYDLLYAKRKQAVKTRDLKQEFKELEASSAPLGNRFTVLSELLRARLSEKEQKKFQGMTSQELIFHIRASLTLSNDEKKILQDLFLKLDAIEFSERESTQEQVTDAEWKRILDSSSIYFL